MSRHQSVSQLFGWALLAAALAIIPGRATAQEPVTISGKVTTASGEALRDVNVAIFDIGVGVWTGQDGTYRLTVPGGRAQGQQVRLTARLIGFRAQSAVVTLTPGGTLDQNFSLPSDPLRLDEIVVTGAGTEQRRERLGTNVATVDSTTLKRGDEQNVIQALAGKVPNVLTNQGSGDAGSSTSIQIRGAKTLGTSQPVIILDGVPISNQTRGQNVLSGAPSPNRAADINPDDIESVEILKGAASTSIYGASAGSAGALEYRTKRGRAGPTTYSLRSTVQFDDPVKTLPVQRTYGVGARGVNALGDTVPLSTQCFTVNCSISSGFFSWGPALPAGTPTFDHGAEMFETGHLMDNALTISGGDERTTFYLSASQLNQDGFIVSNRDRYERYTASFAGSHSLFENMTINARIQVVQTKNTGSDRGNSVNGIGISALRQPPDFNAQNYLGGPAGLHRSWRFPNPGPLALTNNRGFDNPFYALYVDDLEGQTGRYIGNINLNWKPMVWLAVNWTLGGDYNSDDRTYAYGQASSGQNGGSLRRRQFYDRVFDHTLTATGSRSFNPNITGQLTLGQNLNETYFRQIDVTGQTWIAPTPYKLSNTTTRTTPTDDEQRRRVEGYFAQGNLDLYDQVFLQARIRNDGSSAFGIGHQRAWYPGASAAWSFTKKLHVPEQYLTYGKVRMAYGESGQQPNLYTTQSVFISNALADFNPGSLQVPTLNGIGGLYASATRGNRAIAPERNRELEAGFDLTVLSGRADLSVTGYNSKSSDVILPVPIAPSTGFSSENRNAAKISNKGWEITSTIRALQRANMSVQFDLNWARNRNLVTSLGMTTSQASGADPAPTPENCGPEAKVTLCETGIGSSFSGQTTHAQVGYPLGVWRSIDFARCGRGLTSVTFGGASYDVGTACAGPDGIPGNADDAPNGALYIAPNGFPITDPTVRAIGNPWPDWTAGISGTITYKAFQLTAFLDHRHGGDVLNMTRASMYQYGTHRDTEMRGDTVIFGQNMLCQNQTCDVLNGPVVGPGAKKPVVLTEGWFSNSGAPDGRGQGATGGPISTRLEDATFTRLREVSLSYSFRGGWLTRVTGLRQLDAKVSARNLALWTRYSGFDPEVNLGGAQNANRGIDWFNAPLATSWIMQLTLFR